MREIELVFGEVICEPLEFYNWVYFPLTGFISLMARLQDHQSLEMGLVGNEVILGVTIILEEDTAKQI
jgi:hypothetical protein